jgi:hypothetical protein
METAMTKIRLIAATALLASAGALASGPAAATDVSHSISAEQAASSVCASVNQYGPVQVVKTVEDGLGDWIVWVRDKDNDTWMCNASAEGNVYTNTWIRGDLLTGRGEQAIALVPVAYTPSALPEAEKAERLCAAAGRKVEATRIVATVEDGLGDYVVWLQATDNSYWLCNASADAKLYVFERIRSPINGTSASAGFRAA